MEQKMAVKRKAYNKVRIIAWTITLEKDGSVCCSQQNCRFMAFDVDEMAEHYAHCRGQENKSLKMCEICHTGTDEHYKLMNHMLYTHPSEAHLINQIDYVIPESQKPISKVTRASWQRFLEYKGYIKCFYPYCLYITDNMVDMESHFGNCKKIFDKRVRKFICSFCNGRTLQKSKLKVHILDCHPVGTTKTTPTNYVTKELIEVFNKKIRKNGITGCINVDCKFISNEINELKRHYRFCRVPSQENFVACPHCCGWLLPNKLEKHINDFHREPPCELTSPAVQPEEREEKLNVTIDCSQNTINRPHNNTIDCSQPEPGVAPNLFCPLFEDSCETSEQNHFDDLENIQFDNKEQEPKILSIYLPEPIPNLKQYKSLKCGAKYLPMVPIMNIPKPAKNIDLQQKRSDTLLPLKFDSLFNEVFSNSDWGTQVFDILTKDPLNVNKKIIPEQENKPDPKKQPLVMPRPKKKRGRPCKKGRKAKKQVKVYGQSKVENILKKCPNINIIQEENNDDQKTCVKSNVKTGRKRSSVAKINKVKETKTSRKNERIKNVKKLKVNDDEVEKEPKSELERLRQKIVNSGNTNTVPLQISVNNEKWLLDAPNPVLAKTIVQEERRNYSLKHAMKHCFNESHKLLTKILPISSIRNARNYSYHTRSYEYDRAQSSSNVSLQNILKHKKNRSKNNSEFPTLEIEEQSPTREIEPSPAREIEDLLSYPFEFLPHDKEQDSCDYNHFTDNECQPNSNKRPMETEVNEDDEECDGIEELQEIKRLKVFRFEVTPSEIFFIEEFNCKAEIDADPLSNANQPIQAINGTNDYQNALFYQQL